MHVKSIFLAVALTAAVVGAQSAGSFTTLTASDVTTLTKNAAPASTRGSGALQIGGANYLTLELGANALQGYMGSNPGLMKLNTQGGTLLLLSGNGVFMNPTGGPNGGPCVEVGTAAAARCSGNLYALRVQGATQIEGNHRVAGNDTVDGNLKVSGAIYVGTSGWSITAPDYVFAPDYKLLPLDEVEAFVKTNRHLPGMESASDFEQKGSADLVNLNMALLRKVEELTLYTVELNKQVQALKAEQRN